MKNDIEIPVVEGVTFAVARRPQDNREGAFDWYVYLLNKNKYRLHNVLIASKGYGIENNEGVRTATLRQHFESIAPESATVVELIQPDTFGLVNEFWISYYVDGSREIRDRKFVFMPETIVEANLQKLEILELDGILHS